LQFRQVLGVRRRERSERRRQEQKGKEKTHARILTYRTRWYANVSLGGQPQEQPLPGGQGTDHATLPDRVLRGTPGSQRSLSQLGALGSGINGQLPCRRHGHYLNDDCGALISRRLAAPG
jgi:hypothetical protein